MHKYFFLTVILISSLSCSGKNRVEPESGREKKIIHNQNMLHIKQALYTGKINQSTYDSLITRVKNKQTIEFDKVINK